MADGSDFKSLILCNFMTEFHPEPQKLSAMYDYLVAPATPYFAHADVGVVFGRCSGELVDMVQEVAAGSRRMVIGGYVGKDSGL